MNETMRDEKPLTLEYFFQVNTETINLTMPHLFPEYFLDSQQKTVIPDKRVEAIGILTDRVWQVMDADPVLGRLGRETFDRLPEEKRLEILKNAIRLLKVNKEAEEFLASKK